MKMGKPEQNFTIINQKCTPLFQRWGITQKVPLHGNANINWPLFSVEMCVKCRKYVNI